MKVLDITSKPVVLDSAKFSRDDLSLEAIGLYVKILSKVAEYQIEHEVEFEIEDMIDLPEEKIKSLLDELEKVNLYEKEMGFLSDF